MKKWLSILLSAGLLLYPFAAFTADYGSQTSQTQQAPPVAQTLVREGDFAIELAVQLDLGKPASEAAAEDMLAKAGVAPMNGWISDYPMTPEIIGQLQDSIARAAGQGNLPMSAREATKGLYYLTEKFNLPSPAGSVSGAAAQVSPTIVNNYYYDEGPPIMTYYPPPADYAYLYAWVPFPVFWFGFWFPGFFICHNFTTTVVVRSAFVTNTTFVTRTAIVSNRIIDPVTRTVAVIDPVVRTRAGTVQAITALRTGSGQTFRTLTDMRHGVSMSGVSAVRTGTAFAGASRTEGFRSPEVRKSAQNIFSRSVENMSARRGPEGGMARSSSPSGPMRSSYRAPSRSLKPPVTRDNRSEFGRTSVSPGAPQQWNGGPVMRGGHGSAPRSRSLGRGWHGRG